MLKQFSVLNNVLNVSSYDKVLKNIILNTENYFNGTLPIPNVFDIDNKRLNIFSYQQTVSLINDNEDNFLNFHLFNDSMSIDIETSFSGTIKNNSYFGSHNRYKIAIVFKKEVKNEIKNIFLEGYVNSDQKCFSHKMQIDIFDDKDKRFGIIKNNNIDSNISIILEQSQIGKTGRKSDTNMIVRGMNSGINTYYKSMIKTFRESIKNFLEQKDNTILTALLGRNFYGSFRQQDISQDRHFLSFVEHIDSIREHDQILNFLHSNFGRKYTDSLLDISKYQLNNYKYYNTENHDIVVDFRCVDFNSYIPQMVFLRDDLIFTLEKDKLSIEKNKGFNYNFKDKQPILKGFFSIGKKLYYEFEKHEQLHRYFDTKEEYDAYTNVLSKHMNKYDLSFIFISDILREENVDKLEIHALTDDMPFLSNIEKPLKKYYEIKELEKQKKSNSILSIKNK